MITKIALDNQDDVLQCLNCESYFQCEYLREWVKEEKICFVSKFPLIIITKDKPKVNLYL